MGQQQTNPYSQYQKQYTLVSQTQKDELLIRHKHTNKQYMLRKVIVKSQQELQERLKLLNRRRKIKSQHLLNIVNFKPINNDRICGNIIYISLLIEYPFQSLHYQTLHRHSQPNVPAKALSARSSPMYFQEHELWSILYSCVLGLETLYLNDMPHQSITKSLIFVDKDGVVKIGDPVLLGIRTNYDRVIEEFEHQKRKKDDSESSSSIGEQTQRKLSTAKNNPAIDTSFIVSPELISLCKDHQYYFFDKQKSDVFVLGATMIELGLLEDVASVNTSQKAFKTDLSEYFKQNSKLYQNYSSSFLSIIQSMVDLDPKKRPTLSQIVQRIQQFSMEESTISDKNSSLKKNPNDPTQLPHNASFKGYSLSQKFNIPTGNYTAVDYGNKGLDGNLFQSGYLQPVSVIPSVHIPMGSGPNFSISSTNQGLGYPQFPSFSIPQSNKLPQSKPNDVFTQSAVKSVFAKQLPVEIKYTESPLIVPVSNVRFNDQNIPNRNYSTPFNNLNLTESNEKKVIGKTIDKESIVQNKFTLFGPNNIDANNLFQKGHDKEQKITNNVTQRFSFHNFGRIEIPNTSNQTSLNTSALPTPRFQNPSSTYQSTLKINDVTKPLFTPTFHNLSSPNYATNGTTFPINSTLNPPSFANIANTYVQQNRSVSQNSYQSQNSLQRNVYESSYDPKKQGFSISDDMKKVDVYSVDQNLEPYFNNSSVGYTLPKYRPESALSEVVQIKSQQKQGGNQRKFSTNSVKNINNISPTKKIQESESILRIQNSPTKMIPSQSNINSSSAINSITNIQNEKFETNSNTSTVKKQAHGSKKNSGKKYSFYKKDLDEKLQKIQQPSPIVSAEIQRSIAEQQEKIQSPLIGKQLKLSYSQNAVTQVEYQPTSHSLYVEQVEQNGCLYRGYKLNGQRHGNGVLIFADSGFYQGQFSRDQMQGYGKLYYNDKDLAYEGQFKQNCFNGHGILYNNKPEELHGRFDFANLANINNFWVKYDGYFKEDQKSGKCHIFFTNGEQFEGYCLSNTFEGKGMFKTIDGSFVQGIWKNNVLVQIQTDTQLEFNYQ